MRWCIPSFNGLGTSSHYLTIENQEFNRKEAIRAEIKAYNEKLARDEENSTLARFIRNLESRVYAQLSRQLVDALFGENPSTSGIWKPNLTSAWALISRPKPGSARSRSTG